MSGMGRLVLTGIRDDEISVELDPLASVQVGRSLPEIASQIGAAMDDGPAGTVLGADRITTFRGVGREESVEAISDIRISGPGAAGPLSDLASVDATFDDTPIRSRYAGVAARSTGRSPCTKPVIKTRSTLHGWCVPMPRVAVTRRIAISLA